MRTAFRFRHLIFAISLFSPTMPHRAIAQVHLGPPGFQYITAQAASESLLVLRDLDKAIKKQPRSAALWYRRGMVAWTLAARDYVLPPIAALDWTLLGHLADSSLRIAAHMAPAHVEYQLAAGRYMASSFGGVNRTAALVLYNNAIVEARKLDDPIKRADALTATGRMYWRFYDSKEELNYPVGQTARSLGEGKRDPYSMSAMCSYSSGQIWGCITSTEGKGTDYDGEYYYLKAEALLQEAFDSDPKSHDSFINLARLLAGRNRWDEVIKLARDRIRVAPKDAWGWLVLGLGSYRTYGIDLPQAAFDSALARLDAPTRGRLDRIERVLRTADSVKLAAFTPTTRRNWEELYWRVSDPMWSLKGNEPRTEFLARVAYAELRWTMEETGEVGAETDRGEAYIRYGPPQKIQTYTDTLRTTSTWSGPYPFSFSGFDRLRYANAGLFRERFEETPVIWIGNRPLYVDSMQTQVARFRGASDSADVVFAQTAPVERVTSTTIPTPNAHLWVVRDGISIVARDSVPTAGSAQSVFRHRLGRGSYLIRSETTAETSPSTGRATGVLFVGDEAANGFTLRGASISDVLVGLQASRGAGAERWSDIDMTPLAGPLVRGQDLALLWENYEFASDSGSANYTIKIVIERDRSNPGSIVANIVRGLAGSVGINRDENRLEMSFDRRVAYAPVLLESLEINMDETPIGRYRLTVTVTDKGSGRAFSRTSAITIRD